jgi:hypothetical protein
MHTDSTVATTCIITLIPASQINMLTQVDADGGQKFHFLIPHNSKFKLYWDFYMAALILYVCIVVPLQEGKCS